MTIRRSRAILRAATRTLRANPRLVWFTVLSAIVSAIIVGIGGALAWLGNNPDAFMPYLPFIADPPPEAAKSRGMIVFGLATWFGTHLVAPFFAVALARATLDAMATRPWNVTDALRGAGDRIMTIATFAVLNASVGGLLSRIGGEKRGRRRGAASRATAKLLGIGWWAATYLVVPVIAREPRSGFAAVGRSASLLKDTWREAFVGRLVLGWLWAPALVIASVPLALCLILKVQHAGVFALAVVLPAFALVLLGVVLSTLDTIYRCALYVYATEGVVPEPFDDPDLHEIWCVARD